MYFQSPLSKVNGSLATNMTSCDSFNRSILNNPGWYSKNLDPVSKCNEAASSVFDVMYSLTTIDSPSVAAKFNNDGSVVTSSCQFFTSSMVFNMAVLSTTWENTVSLSSGSYPILSKVSRNNAKQHSESVEPCIRRKYLSSKWLINFFLILSKHEIPPLCINMSLPKSNGWQLVSDKTPCVEARTWPKTNDDSVQCERLFRLTLFHAGVIALNTQGSWCSV
ncbi:hypothetical protein PVL30_005349 [Lodderomyces elongisporus]|uniref:uncharacterized protein n=1 Tax=Lodderomyces elongisporus TaxID=36914 RepID=UPI0029213E6E|nr:uncharacterized protein PVL30_005349 [Lodderomyces elongisporus]WLF81551.1 hypothetical protein PVL30_005349 [Lodderomyces elongisporus]